ncbi:hypothetical protein JCM9279_002630 [Rhodotorula babjevae]
MADQVLDDSTLSTSPAPSTTCHLLRLPDELLDAVFRLVYPLAPDVGERVVYTAPLNSPLSRRLYRVQQPSLYRLVAVYHYTNIQLLCDAVRDTPGIGAYVEELVLDATEHRGAARAVLLVRAHGQPIAAVDWDGLHRVQLGLVDPAQLVDLLGRLPRLKCLRIRNLDEALMDAVLVDERAAALLGRLEVLEITADDITSSSQTASVNWVGQVARLPLLKSLEIDQNESGVFFPPLEAPVPVVESLKSLHIVGEDFGQWMGPPLVELAPNLEDLTLSENWQPPDFEQVLLGAPDGLRRLVLQTCCDRREDFAGSRLDYLFPRFPQLEHLSLCANTFEPLTLASFLLPLSALRTVTFFRLALVADALLADLVDGPCRPPALRRLVLDHVTCRRGPTLDSMQHRLPRQDTPSPAKFRMHYGWASPAWLEGCSEAGLVAALEAARTNGIVVEGSAVACVGWEAEFEREKRQSLLLWGQRTGDYIEARRELGSEVVEAYRRRVARARAARSSTGAGDS